MMVKSTNTNSLNENNMTNIFFTQSGWALAGSPCFGFSFELRFHLQATEVLVPIFLKPKKKDFLFRKKLSSFSF